MSVYVDNLVKWPTKIRCFKPGSCHMTADTLEELHAFAKRLGLLREWFQPHGICPHYDLTVKKREAAVKLGALEIPYKEQKARGLGRTRKFGGTLPDLAEQC